MKPPAFQFYADDFLAGTIDMSAEEVGAYIRLLCHQWARGEIPASDPAKLSRVAGGPVSPEVLAKFPGGKNPRLESERSKQSQYRELQAAKGRASAQARLSRGSTAVKPSRSPNGQPKGNSPSPSPSPSPVSGLQKNTLAPAVPRQRNEVFDALIQVTGQNPAMSGGEIGSAIKAIKSVTPDVTASEVRRRAANYKTHFKEATMSASALAKWWTKCDSAGLGLASSGALEPRLLEAWDKA